jgi:hypothetical protein
LLALRSVRAKKAMIQATIDISAARPEAIAAGHREVAQVTK